MIEHKFSKIRLFIILLIVFSPFLGQSQDFRLGFKANPSFSVIKPSSDYHESVGTKVGFSYGLLFDYFIKDNYAISSEFAISTMGGQVEYNKSDTSIVSNINLRYIEIPITLKLLTKELTDNVKVYGKFGLNLAFRIKAEADVEYKKGGIEYKNDDIKNANNYIQPFNTSLLFGAGIEYNISDNLDLVLGLSYNNGFLNVMKSKSIYRQETTNLISGFEGNINYLAVNVGLLF